MQKIKEIMELKNLSKFAANDSDAIRFKESSKEFDIRPSFFKDIDKIIYSTSYNRYKDKTQVFSFTDNDHVSKRFIHVQYVSKIGRTIGRALGLNTDLIEAAALGHDLGHVPFGHVGERILNDISLNNNEGYFNHNIQSVRILISLENDGNGTNMTVQVLDAIMCHNGEFCLEKYSPIKKTKEEFLLEYKNSYIDEVVVSKLKPMTLEGCVVRISDVIGYIGRDIEDAITLGYITKEDIPEEIREILGTRNDEIINTIVLDIIQNSFEKPYITMSPKIFEMLKKLKEFNSENIYKKANSLEEIEIMRNMFEKLFDNYINDIDNSNKSSEIYTVFLDHMNDDYIKNTTPARKVIDFIAGMTDDYFILCYNDLFRNSL